MKILIINCGSSSIKFQLFDMTTDAQVLAKGCVDRVGLKESEILYHKTGNDKVKKYRHIADHTEGIEAILAELLDTSTGVIHDINEIKAVGHRIVHGGDKFTGSVMITDEVIAEVEECIELAPLHNPPNLKGIDSIKKILPNVMQCGTFDTAFHHTIPDYAYIYGIPYEYYEKFKIRRYGFHGASHNYVTHKAAQTLGQNYKELRMVSCHLGNGSSVAAVKYGESVDTSMGLTPVEGLMMGTRCGDIDAGALLYLMEKINLDPHCANYELNKKSGFLGVSGISSDMRDVQKAAWKDENKRAILSLNMFYYRVRKYIGAYAAAMGGLDVIIFTGGIGEYSPETRQAVCENLEFMGVKFDDEVNSYTCSVLTEISLPDSKVKVMVIPTNEELVIALDTLKLYNGHEINVFA
ncbi:MAG: acetate kinase [Bacteroidetes bacterium GWA2_30_7]|nr:MAG: acetate kinase [Bacteroidetes bacterium GWA2_30_7]